MFGTEIIKKVVEPFDLTPRELDVVLALAAGKVTAREIAKYLHVSESTVNNHVDNISQKTGLGGKAEILSFVVQRLFVYIENSRFFMATPNVLIVDDHEDLADTLTEAYRRRGCQAMAAYNGDSFLLDRIAQNGIDLIICDYMLRDTNGIDFLNQVAQRLNFMPAAILISGSPPDSLELPNGAFAWLKKPFEQNQLFQLSIEAFINSDRRAGRKERTTVEANVNIGRRNSAFATELSESGMLVQTSRPGETRIGNEANFELEMPDSTVIPGTGTIVHTEKCNESGLTRLGIKFTQLTPERRKYIHDYVHTKNILKFLPLDQPLLFNKKRGA